MTSAHFLVAGVAIVLDLLTMPLPGLHGSAHFTGRGQAVLDHDFELRHMTSRVTQGPVIPSVSWIDNSWDSIASVITPQPKNP